MMSNFFQLSGLWVSGGRGGQSLIARFMAQVSSSRRVIGLPNRCVFRETFEEEVLELHASHDDGLTIKVALINQPLNDPSVVSPNLIAAG